MGRPLKYSTADQLKSAIDAYFKSCWITPAPTPGDPSPVPYQWKPYTMTGLSMAVGLDRGQLVSYAKKEAFSSIVHQAVNIVREGVEARLLDGGKGMAGAIFWLKNNAGWVEKTETKSEATVKISENIGLLQLFSKKPPEAGTVK